MLFLFVLYLVMTVVGILYTEYHLTEVFGKEDHLTVLFRLISFLPIFNLIFPVLIVQEYLHKKNGNNF